MSDTAGAANSSTPAQSEQSGRIVDFSDFEHQKENIQPLSRGRSASALAQLYGKHNTNSALDSLDSAARQSLQPTRPLAPLKQRESQGDMERQDSGVDIRVSGHLQARNAQFQAEIAAMDPAETDDPLDVYFRYIQWLFEVFPQAHGNQSVIKLVEKPLKLFCEQERYRNDTRYVKMWIWYTGIITTSQEVVFQFLIANKIGDSLAVLYEEYAKLLESQNKARKADEVYQLGIARKAQPLARIQRRYNDFQRRLVAQTMRDVDTQQQHTEEQGAQSSSNTLPAMQGRLDAANDENNAPGHSNRTMLGTKRSGRSVRSAAANTLPASQRGLSNQASASAAPAASRPNARIAVFSDPDGRASGNIVHSRSSSGGGGTQGAEAGLSGTPWLDIGSDEGRRKENIPEATSWRGQTLEQRRLLTSSGRVATVAPHGVPVMEKFTVFNDSGDEDQGASAMSSEREAQGSVLGSKHLSGVSAIGASSSSLLTSFDTSTSRPNSRSEKSKGKAKEKSKDKVKGTKEKERGGKGEEKMVMPSEILFPAGDGVPQCVEEARARLTKYKFDYDQWLKQEQAAPSTRSTSNGQGVSRYINLPAQIPAAIRSSDNEDSSYRGGGIPIDSDDEDNDIVDESGFGRNKRKSVATSSPTINTRVAQKGMLGIWNDLSDTDSDGDSMLDFDSCNNDGKGKGARSSRASVSDDDYQFTMGPVKPNVVPGEASTLPPMIPSSARPGSRFESFLDAGMRRGENGCDKDEYDPPTVVINSIRAAKRQELQQARIKPTPLAARVQTPLVSSTAQSMLGQSQQSGQQPRGLRSVDEDSEDDEYLAESGNAAAISSCSAHAESLMRTLEPHKTPLTNRIEVFRDEYEPAPASNNRNSQSQSAKPEPLFAPSGSQKKDNQQCGNPRKPGIQVASESLEHDYPPIPPPTSARKGNVSSMHFSTPGYTRTGSGFSVSGAEFTSISGFTGISTIGGPTTSLLMQEGLDTISAGSASVASGQEEYTIEYEDEDDEDDVSGEYSGYRRLSNVSAQTPLRKRLSMAARDLGKITPRFPKTAASENEAYNSYTRTTNSEIEDDDEEDEEDEPCTENMGEFADLDSQMNELQMELGAQFMQQSGTADTSEHYANIGTATPSSSQNRSAPLFTVFRD
ncbi:protein kinase [Coemansia spiralis]|uniref:Protein kinase n=1 Tax=Coemansia spiralis TaxID=417178 RepID=A0A9W8KVI8_9FUNG|nr:protein kinase [Coemansia spiralis]